MKINLFIILFSMGLILSNAQDNPSSRSVVVASSIPAFRVTDLSSEIGSLKSGSKLEVAGKLPGGTHYRVTYINPETGLPMQLGCKISDIDPLLGAPSGTSPAPVPPPGEKTPPLPAPPPEDNAVSSKSRNAIDTPAASTPNTPPAAPSRETNKPILPRISSSLFLNDRPFDESASAMAARCRLPSEAKTKSLSSFRAYKPGFECFGIKPNMAAVYGDPDCVSEINLVFSNTGDSIGQIEDDSKRSQLVAKAMPGFKKEFKEQEEILEKNLTELLGKSVKQQLGAGNNREYAQRWDRESGVTLLLTVLPQKMIALRVWKKNVADRKGMLKPLSDAELRAACSMNVEKRPNGDVVVTEIPMIDQGPKGYCVPATYERVLRYLGMWGDMYTLAMNGQTQLGGGTCLSDINGAVAIILSQAGRRFQSLPQMDVIPVKKYIDMGIPVIWSCHIVKACETQAGENTYERRRASPEEWKKKIRSQKPPAGQINENRGHVRLITGYNSATREICFSDSWGADHAESWIPVKTARFITKSLEAIMW
ncbi:MAG: C39 family peptidase [Verrucomicrobiae bacterium]|nr:C39 family peptidase [Verrucomicrobiae bacterium]